MAAYHPGATGVRCDITNNAWNDAWNVAMRVLRAHYDPRCYCKATWPLLPDIKRTIAPKSLDRFKQRIRDITRRAKGASMKTIMEELAPYMRGWRGYFGFCQTPEVLVALTRWVRLRLRAALWRQWKTPRRRRAALISSG
jgi:hypothetical protein